MSDYTHKWAPGLPHMEVRLFLVEKLRSERATPGPALDRAVCRLLKVKPVRPVSTDLAAAISLIPEGWWWHISHLEAQVIPTRPAPGMEGLVSNGASYDGYGRPVTYRAMCHDREDLPLSVCTAMIMAAYDLPAAFVVQASARRNAENDTKEMLRRLRRDARRQKAPTPTREDRP